MTAVLAETTEHRIYLQIREAILNGEAEAGKPLRETQLAEMYGVSRTPVRAALSRLAFEGFVENRPNVGAIVRHLSPEEANQILELRCVLESYAAGQAAEHASDAELRQISAICEQMREEMAYPIPDITRMARLNRDFHMAIGRAAHNPFLERQIKHYCDISFMVRSYRRFSREDLQRSHGHHREIAQALNARDPQWTSAMMTVHIGSARNFSWKPKPYG